jgi:hypothetical protein
MSTFYRRNLPHIEKDGASYFVNFSTRNDFVLPEEARTLIFDIVYLRMLAKSTCMSSS